MINNRYIYLLMYFIGFAVFGFFYWLLNGILDVIIPIGFHDTSNFGGVSELLMYLWLGIIVIYMLFGGIWLIRLFNMESDGVTSGGGVR